MTIGVVTNDARVSSASLTTAGRKGVHVFGWGFSAPSDAVAVDGKVYVANLNDHVIEIDAASGALIRVISDRSFGAYGDDLAARAGRLYVAGGRSITELNASTGRVLKVISGKSYRFNFPGSMAFDGPDLFVANAEPQSANGRGRGSITELNVLSGALVRVISGPPYDFLAPSLAISKGHLFVVEGPTGASLDGASPGGRSVTEYDVRTGAVLRVISASKYRLDETDAVQTVGGDVFVSSGYPGPVYRLTEIDGSTGALVRVISGRKYHLNEIGDVTPHGHDLFVANGGNRSVTELRIRTGALVRVLSGARYQFNSPLALAFSGNSLIVTNFLGNSVTELDASTRKLLRVVTGSPYRFDDPAAEVSDGGDLFVASGVYDGYNAIDELDATTGALIRIIRGPSYRFNSLDALAMSGGDLFAVSGASHDPVGDGGWVTEVNAASGALVRVIRSPSFNNPDAIAVAEGDVFVANMGDAVTGSPITEFSASTGTIVRVISGRKHRLNDPDALAVVGGDLFVANVGDIPHIGASGASITEISVSSGALVRVISAPWPKNSWPNALAVKGDALYVAMNDYRGTPYHPRETDFLAELNTTSGTVSRVVHGTRYDFSDPSALMVDANRLFVANEFGDSVTEIDTSTGRLVRVLRNCLDEFSFPDALAVVGRDLFVANGGGSSITELAV